MPEISTDKVCFVIVKARESQIQEGGWRQSGSNAVDDAFSSAYSAAAQTGALNELREFISAMDVDEQCELVALCWVGRDDFFPDEWEEAVEEARGRRETPTADYLLGLPQLADFLQEGLSKFDLSCEGFEASRL